MCYLGQARDSSVSAQACVSLCSVRCTCSGSILNIWGFSDHELQNEVRPSLLNLVLLLSKRLPFHLSQTVKHSNCSNGLGEIQLQTVQERILLLVTPPNFTSGKDTDIVFQDDY